MQRQQLVKTDNPRYSALAVTGRHRELRWLAISLASLFGLFILSLIVAPWQQNVPARGRVIAYAPLDRQQAVEAPIQGRVTKWYVGEGDIVDEGQIIAELADNDPSILQRLRQEKQAAKLQIKSVEDSMKRIEEQIASEREARDSAIETAKLKIEVAENDYDAAIRALDAERANYKTAKINRKRISELFDKGLSSKRDFELAELDYQKSSTAVDRAKAKLESAKAKISSAKAELAEKSSTALAKISSTRSGLDKARAERAKAQAILTKIEVRLSRQEQMKVFAPRDGTVLRLLAKQGTEMVKAGEPLALFVPSSASQAVEVYVDGNNAPLVEPGRKVRIQFEGWPAVQFVGWPSVAVGTFGGVVAFVDSHDDGRGRFRVLVKPDPEDEPWPDSSYLRQGVRVNAWLLLNEVSLGFELWRQLNGFPPALTDSAGESKAKAIK